MKYDIIIFDADETLFDFKKTERVALRDTMLEFNVDYNEAEHLNIYKEINTAIWKELEDGRITQNQLKVERFSRFLGKLNYNIEASIFGKAYMNHLAKGSYLFKDSVELVENLSNGFKLMIITNGLKSVQEHRIKKSIIADYFESIIVSEEVGVSKPDPKIFEIALRTYNIDKKKILIVGDSLTSDIQGGINYGIDTCWFNPHQKENSYGIKPTYEIYSLSELTNIVNKSR
ncbi:YjjG family noncanonical pyrimidine nucleotidase [Haloplasma contractile]|uniref:2-haloacid dehalogenase protein n=1 Tax=Haloplasma contractile SSD-17B TaxID=1033810 RepID=F7Q1V9_9MOLU|nr:YjjG family noncanonical pyrimidine nucleotidase [Haloplasma contractile]ERJ12230.1 2-haloacid dehalogenase protein [Haloplasma contractile SSD-17B]